MKLEVMLSLERTGAIISDYTMRCDPTCTIHRSQSHREIAPYMSEKGDDDLIGLVPVEDKDSDANYCLTSELEVMRNLEFTPGTNCS